MGELRGSEEWVRQCMEAALPGTVVKQYDDGSRPSMHDLNLFVGRRHVGAAEVSAAGDPKLIQLWNAMNGERGVWLVPGLVGGWLVIAEPGARANTLRRELPRLLGALESQGRTYLSAEEDGDGEAAFAAAIRVHSARQSGTSKRGSVYFTVDLRLEKAGGWVPATADPVAQWLGQWLCSPSQADNRAKLAASDASQRHFFTLVPGFSTARFEVEYVLMSSDIAAPTVAPDLPPEVTHCWIMSTMSSGLGWRWSPHERLVELFQATVLTPRAAGNAHSASCRCTRADNGTATCRLRQQAEPTEP